MMKIKLSLLSVLLLTILSVSCRQRESEGKKLLSDNELVQLLKSQISSGKKEINFSEIASFKWESLLILTPYSLPEQIGEKYDMDLSSVKHFNINQRDDINLIIFLEGGKPARAMEYPRYPGDFSENEINLIEKKDANFQLILTNKKSVGGTQWIRIKKK